MWDVLRARTGGGTGGLLVPRAAGPGCCAVCRGPTRPGYPRCFHCTAHRQAAGGLLADVMVPVSYAVAGTGFARKLWAYKSDARDRDAARAALRALLLVFLHDHGECVWRAAGMAAPTHVTVVPTGQGRPGVHPLRELIEPYLRLGWIELVTRPGDPVWGRDLELGRFWVPAGLDGVSVLLLDDTWTTGASVQSASAALKQAGAGRVAAVLLGRHVNPARPDGGSLLDGCGFEAGKCALERTA